MFGLDVEGQVSMTANRSEVWLIGAPTGTHSLHVHLMWFLVMAERPSETVPWNMIPREKQWFQDTLLLVPGQQYLVWALPTRLCLPNCVQQGEL